MDGLVCSEILEWLESSKDDDVDAILGAALEAYEAEAVSESAFSSASLPPVAGHSPVPTTISSASPRPLPPTTRPSPSSAEQRAAVRFATPKTDEEVQQARAQGIPVKTVQDTKYCFGIWEAWREHRNKTTGADIARISELSHQELDHWLTRFILEVRKKTGEEYPPNTVHHICCGLMRHLRWNGQPCIDFFSDPTFASFKASLDSEMRRLQEKGAGSKNKQAEVLTEEEEEILWEKGLLGGATPQSLLDTMVFYNGLYFALRSGKEHRQLRFDPCQITLVQPAGERSYLKYVEDVSKNRPGGIKGRRVKPKVVQHHANSTNPERCFVRLFQKYQQLTPTDRPSHAFYLQPLHNPTEACWYSKKPLGYHTLSNTVAHLCKAAGISGYKTNHSLRATAATRLYESGVDEQLVMERTGHRSLDGVRSYKRTSDTQRRELSDILNCKRVRVEEPTSPASTSANPPQTPFNIDLVPRTTNMQANTQNSTSGLFHFTSCSNITINITRK